MTAQTAKPKGYSKSLKRTILFEAKKSGNISEVARKYGISRGTIYDWKNELKNKETKDVGFFEGIKNYLKSLWV